MPVQKISVQRACDLHTLYMNNLTTAQDEPTRAVMFAFDELSEAIEAFENKNGVKIHDDPDYGFACYFGRYPEDEPNDLGDRNTVIIQFLKNVNLEWEAIQGEIYNFGDLRPPRIINNEQVTQRP